MFSSRRPFQPVNNIRDILTSKEPLVTWLVPDFIPQGSLIALAGAAGVGKSALSYSIALSVASGYPVLNGLFPAMPPQPVLYFDQENSRPDRNQYLRWAWNGLGCPDLSLLDAYFWSAHFTLGGEDWLERASEWVKFVRPALMVFDTASPCFGVRDENDNAEATQIIEGIRDLQSLVQPTIAALVLKHARILAEKDGENVRYTLRGAKAWEGAVDGIIYHLKSAGRPRKDDLKNTRLEPAKTRAFGLRKPVRIEPEWVTDDHEGLRLRGKFGDGIFRAKKREEGDNEDE